MAKINVELNELAELQLNTLAEQLNISKTMVISIALNELVKVRQTLISIREMSNEDINEQIRQLYVSDSK